MPGRRQVNGESTLVKEIRWCLAPTVPESRTSLAIVLRWRAYGESDKIATLLTEDFGKLTGIAKGAKNSRRRFANSLEPLARVRVHFRHQPTASLAFLESCELCSSTAAFTEPTRFAYASYVAELADQLTIEDDPVRTLYALLDEALAELERGPATTAFLRGFELQLLTRAGFEPQLDRCTRCGRSWGGEASAHLSLNHGTIACAACRSDGDAAVAVDTALLVDLAELKTLSLAACRDRAFGAAARDAGQVTGRLLALHLVRPLRSVRLIEQLTAASVEGAAPSAPGPAPRDTTARSGGNAA
jgi:DNA repair protein RecO (recombination protein O)